MSFKKEKIAVFASGYGSNLQALIESCGALDFPANIELVVSDQSKAQALHRAQKAHIETLYCSPRDFNSKKEHEEELILQLRERNIEWIVLAGYMRILGPDFIEAFKERIINIHPSLLPKYPGLKSIQRAYENNDSEIGVTVHFVDHGVDTGPIIAQERCRVEPGETLEKIEKKVHALEHALYPQVIKTLMEAEQRKNEG